MSLSGLDRRTIEAADWGRTVPICSRRGCPSPASCVLDRQILCLDCADDLLERMAALELEPRLRELLPAWSDH